MRLRFSFSLSYVCKVSPKKNGGIGVQARKKSKVLDLHPCIVISRSGGKRWKITHSLQKSIASNSDAV